MAPGVRRQAGLAVAVGVLATFCSPSKSAEMPVKVNERQVTVPISKTKVSDVLARSGADPRPGMLRSVVTGKLLRPNGNPPLVHVDGKPASLASHLHPHAIVVAGNGVDTVEAVQRRIGPGPMPAGLPDVERTLYEPGQPRREMAWVGALSGERLATLVTEPEIPARPMPGKVVGLTFDDGPHRQFTPAILDILREEGIRATFCIIAQHGRDEPDLVKAVVDAGHVVCNHTVNHRILTGRSPDYVYGQIAGGSEFLTSITGSPPPLFRAPSGRVSPEVISVAHAQGMRVLGWTVESNDYQLVPAQTIVKRVLEAVRPGSIILLHDGGGDRSSTVAALRPIIAGLRAQGYSFGTPVSVAP
ncbi:MAG: polysaccharide deacetylase family protein [Actinomycetota bacterium]|nr:polysaccharide deacetylase family protein [Actinomycetota bacterium]